MAQGIALALCFKLGGAVLRTVIVREWSELLVLGAIIFLPAAMSLSLIHIFFFDVKKNRYSKVYLMEVVFYLTRIPLQFM